MEDLDRDGRIILKWILKKQDGGVGRIDLDQNRDRWRAVVNKGFIKCREFLDYGRMYQLPA